MVTHQEFAVIVAGGTGTRMRSSLPKQFMLLAEKPILMHTIEAFHRYNSSIELVVVLPKAEHTFWDSLQEKHNFRIKHLVVEGGATRFQSVANGIARCAAGSLVAVHDGVRPLVLPEIIDASFRLAAIHQSAVAAVRMKESIREVNQEGTRAVDRSRFRLIQTPQTFQTDILKAAFQQPEETTFTDEASVVERLGYSISLFEGSYENIKITTPEDLILAEAVIAKRS